MRALHRVRLRNCSERLESEKPDTMEGDQLDVLLESMAEADLGRRVRLRVVRVRIQMTSTLEKKNRTPTDITLTKIQTSILMTLTLTRYPYWS